MRADPWRLSDGSADLTRNMPIQLGSDLSLRQRRGERPVIVKELPLSMFVDAHEAQCEKNHYQTLERIRERGGFGASEAIAVLSCLPFDGVQAIGNEAAHRILYAMIATHNRGMRVAEAAAQAQACPVGEGPHREIREGQ